MENTVHYTSVNMAQLNATSSFTAGAQFGSRKALYGARDEYHRKSGYKLVVKNCNKEQVIFECHQHNAVEPKIKCPLQVRANSGKRSEYWMISPHAELSHLCNIENSVQGNAVGQRYCVWHGATKLLSLAPLSRRASTS